MEADERKSGWQREAEPKGAPQRAASRCPRTLRAPGRSSRGSLSALLRFPLLHCADDRARQATELRRASRATPDQSPGSQSHALNHERQRAAPSNPQAASQKASPDARGWHVVRAHRSDRRRSGAGDPVVRLEAHPQSCKAQGRGAKGRLPGGAWRFSCPVAAARAAKSSVMSGKL